MTEGIKKAVEIEKSATDELSFIAIVAGNIDYLPQLKILSEETNAPILIATFDYSEDEHYGSAYVHYTHETYCHQPQLFPCLSALTHHKTL